MTFAPARALDAAQSTWDRIAASDPGLERLGTAARTTVGVAAAVGVADLAVRLLHAPFTTEILAAVIAEISSISVRDPKPAERRLTTLLLPLPACAAIVLGTLLVPHRIVSDAAFIAIMFAAVALRGCGTRATSLAMLAFFGYFFSLFLGATLAGLPWLLAGVAIGTACTFLFRFILWPDRPERIVRRAIATFRARARAVLDALPAALHARHWEDRPRRRLRRRIELLRDCALAIEDRLAESGSFSDAEKTMLRLTLFDAELSAENLTSRALAAVNARPERTADIARAVAAAGNRLPRAPTSNSHGKRMPTEALHAMRAGCAAMDAIEPEQPAGSLPGPPARSQLQRGVQSKHGAWSQSLSPAIRQAIQVTLASSIALVCGEFLSPHRWYWAVLAAFVVFSGTQSSGEIRARAWSRSLGTALGIVAGLGVVIAVGNDHPLQLVLMFVFMFGAMYFFGTAYGVFVFFITSLLALLYLILGSFSPSLLLLRLIETAVGSTIGILVASFVLPTRTRDALANSAAGLLGTLAAVIECSTRRLTDPTDDDDPVSAAQDVDRAVADLMARARPMGIFGAGGPSRTEVRQRILVLNACARYARNLARIARRAPGTLPQALREPMRDLAGGVASNLRRRADRLTGKDVAPHIDVAPRLAMVKRELEATSGSARDAGSAALRELNHIERALAQLGSG